MNGLGEMLRRRNGGEPALLLDESRARANIARMADRAAGASCRLRPHFKTHQSAEVGGWFAAAGVDRICVSSLPMAAYFADAGWRDITVALPFNPLGVESAAALAGRIDLGLLAAGVDSAEAVAAVGARAPVRAWIKVDTGYGRAGIGWDDPGAVAGTAAALDGAPGVRFSGLLTHAGHSYGQSGPDRVRGVWSETIARLREAGAAVEKALGAPCPLSAGDTPGCSLAADLSGPDELRPGNFVFYDLMQERLGACSAADIAVAAACPVIGLRPGRREALLHGGAVHLSKEFLPEAGGGRCFGRAARWTGDGWSGPLPAAVTSLSQEHGVLKVEDDDLWAELKVGSALPILPVHSCLTADLHPRYLAADGRTIGKRRSNDSAGPPREQP